MTSKARHIDGLAISVAVPSNGVVGHKETHIDCRYCHARLPGFSHPHDIYGTYTWVAKHHASRSAYGD